jgi:hypothetical protein
MSIQKLEVKAVIAPSALGNRAEINARIKIMDQYGGIWFKANVGNKSSPVAVILF